MCAYVRMHIRTRWSVCVALLWCTGFAGVERGWVFVPGVHCLEAALVVAAVFAVGIVNPVDRIATASRARVRRTPSRAQICVQSV
jgi:hypothetical protein